MSAKITRAQRDLIREVKESAINCFICMLLVNSELMEDSCTCARCLEHFLFVDSYVCGVGPPVKSKSR